MDSGRIKKIIAFSSDHKDEIASYYDSLNAENLEDYLAILSNYRNLCAHEDILYDHRTQRSIPDSKYHIKLNIDTKNSNNNTGSFATIVCVSVIWYFPPCGINTEPAPMEPSNFSTSPF